MMLGGDDREGPAVPGRGGGAAPSPKYPSLAGDWDGLLVMWGSAAWEGHRLGSHSLAEAFSARHPVLYIDPPISATRLLRDARARTAWRRPRLELLAPRLARLTLFGPPGGTHTAAFDVARAWTARPVRRAVRALGGSVRAVLSGRVLYDPFGMCDEQVRVFRVSDDFSAGASLAGVAASRIEEAELRLARRADVVVCVSPPLVEKWRALGFDPVLIPNGCDHDFLGGASSAPPPDDVRLPAPIVGVSGQLSGRIDLELLEAVADRGHSLLLVGRRRDDLPARALDDLLARPNVQWLGMKPYAELPPYLGAMDVGLVPYGDTAFNRASFPLKTLEYLAAGLPVVASDLPAIRWFDTDLVRVAGDPGAFAAAVDEAIRVAGDPDEVARRKSFAAGHSWQRRAADYESAIASVVGDD